MTPVERLFPTVANPILIGLIVGLLISFNQNVEEFFSTYRFIRTSVMVIGLVSLMLAALSNARGFNRFAGIWLTSLCLLLGVTVGAMF